MDKVIGIIICAILALVIAVPLLLFNILNVYAEKAALKDFTTEYDAKVVGKSSSSYLLDMNGRPAELKFAFYLDSVSSPKRASYQNTDVYTVYYGRTDKRTVLVNAERIGEDGELPSSGLKGEDSKFANLNSYDKASVFCQGVLELGLWSTLAVCTLFITYNATSKVYTKIQGSK